FTSGTKRCNGLTVQTVNAKCARCLRVAQRCDKKMSILRMKHAVKFFFWIEVFLGALFFTGCETMPEGIQQAKIAMAQKIQAEPLGDYFIGRRYYKPDFKFWGYVRRPGQPWSTAQLVMLNEKQKLAPDRERLSSAATTITNTKSTGISAATKFTSRPATASIRSSI